MSAKRAARAPSIFLHARAPHAHPHSFPTRRSSDLLGAAARAQELQEQLFKVELLTARWAVLEVLAKLPLELRRDRKSTRLNSSHDQISYAVFCLKKKNTFIIVTARIEPSCIACNCI